MNDPNKPMTLYEIAHEVSLVLSHIDENGELAIDAELALNNIEMKLETKVDNVCRFIRQQEAQAAGYKAEADRLAKLAKTHSNAADRLKTYTKTTMEVHGIDNLTTERFKLSIATNSQPSVTIDEGKAIPKPFQRVTIDLDKTKVAEAVAAGKKIASYIHVQRGTHLRIR